MIHIDTLIPGGQAISTAPDGRKIFFWNALPGEMVEEYNITKKKPHYYEAIATTIQNPSPYRVKSLDPCYLSTSPWQILDWDYENQQKSALVAEIFHEHHIDIDDVPPIITDDHQYYYRNKMEYSLYWDNDSSKIQLAFHARGSHRKIPITQSSIERPEIFQKATDIITDLNSHHKQARTYQSLLLRCNGDGVVSGGLYLNGQPHPIFPTLSDSLLDYTYSYSPNGFFQINLSVYELALKEIQKHITTDEVLDLYSGVGTIGLSVARDHHLTSVESDNYAFRELCNNIYPEGSHAATNNHIQPLKVECVRNGSIVAIHARSEDVTDYINPSQTVILDPPRAGCDKKLINKLLDVTPPVIIYLSCNPATQARDISALLAKYIITSVQSFNFFPRTPHIENLVILSLK